MIYGKLHGSVILMGMKHSGKTSLGRMLSERCSSPFFDLDDLISDCAAQPVKSVRELYRVYGKEAFLSAEHTAATRLARQLVENCPAVAALGGGTIENTAAMEELAGAGVFIYLECPPEVLFRRILASGLPPFLSEDHPYEDFLALYGKRSRLLEAHADIRVSCNDETLNEVLETLVKKIWEATGGRK